MLGGFQTFCICKTNLNWSQLHGNKEFTKMSYTYEASVVAMILLCLVMSVVEQGVIYVLPAGKCVQSSSASL